MAKKRDIGIFLFIIGVALVLQPIGQPLFSFYGIANSTVGAFIAVLGLFLFVSK